MGSGLGPCGGRAVRVPFPALQDGRRDGLEVGGEAGAGALEHDAFERIGDGVGLGDGPVAGHAQLDVGEVQRARGARPELAVEASGRRGLGQRALDRGHLGVGQRAVHQAVDRAAHQLPALAQDVERDRVLSEHEIALLFLRLPQAGMAETSEIALLLQLATITRIGEVLAARWEHVDLDNRRWLLPDTKNGKRHEIWLSDFAIAQLQRLRLLTGASAWLFPASRARKDAAPGVEDHVCVRTAAKQVADRQRGDAAPMSGRSKNTTALMLPEGHWTPHDLRRTGATLMAEAGILPDVVERCLNHTEEKKVKRIYQRAKYEGPMREAWQLLGDKLTGLMGAA